MKRSKALVESRQRKLISLLNHQDTLSVTDAAAALDVSPITIRRDLELLEAQKLVIRHHGGARLAVEVTPSIPQLSTRDHLQMPQKERIAHYVASLVEDRNTIFLNAGSTTYLVMKELAQRSVRLITNNVHAIELFSDAKADLMMIGGEYNAHNCSFLGDMASQLLSHLHGDLCILGVNGINSADGITTYSYQETLLNQAMLRQCSGQHIVVADGTKIGKMFCFTSAPLESIDMLVTDSSANPDELERIAAHHVKVVLADQLPNG